MKTRELCFVCLLLITLFIPVFVVHSIVSNSEQSYVTGTNANREEIQKSSICNWVLSFHMEVHFRNICCLKSNCWTFKDFSIESQTKSKPNKKMLLLHLFSNKLCMYIMFYTWVKKLLQWKHLCISEKALNGAARKKVFDFFGTVWAYFSLVFCQTHWPSSTSGALLPGRGQKGYLSCLNCCCWATSSVLNTDSNNQIIWVLSLSLRNTCNLPATWKQGVNKSRAIQIFSLTFCEHQRKLK